MASPLKHNFKAGDFVRIKDTRVKGSNTCGHAAISHFGGEYAKVFQTRLNSNGCIRLQGIHNVFENYGFWWTDPDDVEAVSNNITAYFKHVEGRKPHDR